ncbi:MAG: hypothetical protein KI790_18595, partial [Cyclobacteriaceae bacterium]|nr:hypothetical protein [Cyclobacteriaceae bacterium HetDA_MAG_MS6]
MSYSGTIWCLFIWSILFLWGCDSQPNKPAPLILLDMVHDNPGEEPFKSAFKDPKRLAKWGYDGQVINDFTFIQTAATFRSYDPRIVPIGSEASDWIQDRINQVEDYINTCEAAGIDSYIFTDLFILPKTVLSLYAGSVQDAGGKFTLDLPKVRELHEAMFKELFERFPRLDGLVVRTGETYLNNMVHHTGNGPFAREISQEEGIQKHVQLINFLREEVCQKYDKKLVYRTWAFGGIHTDPDVYLAVTDQVAPHPNLYFSVKHTAGDYHRKFAFNPTLGIGSHHQIVEVQCQREYEGKSAHPNYIAQSVIEGFEEYSEASHPKGLRDLRNTENLAGIWTWSRGGGWKGPYIPHELWNEINAFVLARWAKNPAMRSQDGLREYAIGHLGLQGEEIER